MSCLNAPLQKTLEKELLHEDQSPVFSHNNMSIFSVFAERLNPNHDFLISGDNTANMSELFECIQLLHNEGWFISLNMAHSVLIYPEQKQHTKSGGREGKKRKLKNLKGLMSWGLR